MEEPEARPSFRSAPDRLPQPRVGGVVVDDDHLEAR
jgi:hypothetical protein